MLTGPTRTPSPIRPTRPRSASSSSSRVRVNTARSTAPSTASNEASRSRARSTRSAAFCSGIGHAARRCSPPIKARRWRRAQSARSLQGSRRSAARARSSIRATTNSRSARAWPASFRRLSTRQVGASGSPAANFASPSRLAASVANRTSQSVRPPTTPASRESRSHDVTEMGLPLCRRRPPASQAKTSSRRYPPSGKARSPRSDRPATRAVRGITAAPLSVTPAPVSCSWANRAYGWGLACRIAMRSSGVPERAASTIDRTATRTSSSQSDVVTIRVRCLSTTPGTASVSEGAPTVPGSMRRTERSTSASARASPVIPANTVSVPPWAMAPSSLPE